MSPEAELGFSFKDQLCWNPKCVNGHAYRCGHCLPCLRHRQQEWVSRLCEQLRHSTGNYFVLFTYAPECVPVDDAGLMHVCKKHILDFNRDLRNRFSKGRFFYPLEGRLIRMDLPKCSFKYYITSEYGPEGGRPH